MRRALVIVGGLVLALVAGGWFALPALTGLRTPIRVGLLHSLTGPMAISEASMVDAERLALEEIKAGGGLLGRPVEWVIADGKSDPSTFAREAQRLIDEAKVSVIFGCWNSACRKAVRPVVERADHLLFFPVAYEGLEQSPNIVYTGAAPNQQIMPAVKWCSDDLKANRFFLVGSDSVYPRSANTILKDQLKALGATLVAEEYLSRSGVEIDAVVKKIVATKPDIVMSTIEGDTNLPFYQKARAAGITPAKIPIFTYTMTEDEFREFPAGSLTGDYAVCNYFQSIDRAENAAFVRNFKSRYGQERTTCDAIDTAYNSVRLWAQAVTAAETDETRLVRSSLLKQSLDAPEGVISLDRETQHTWRPLFIGKIRSDGQVDIVSTVAKPIRPVPFPFSRRRLDWEAFVEGLRTSWRGGWEAPAGGSDRSLSNASPPGGGL